MKTSNYIIIAFFTFLFGSVLMLFVAAKFQPKDQLISVNKALEPFSVVIAEPGAGFTLKFGDPKIFSFSSKDSCFLPKFDVHNDTLIIFPYTDKNIKQDIEIFGRNIHEIQGKENSQITVQGGSGNSLSINLNKAMFSYYENTSGVKGSIVKLFARESDVKINSASFGKLEVQLIQTKIDAWNNSIESISGTIKNKSQVYARVLKNINLEADSTSEFRIHK